ncbi:MAG: glutathione S-transferase family protein [Alphaproteobacteria bacterium]|nr:glutathione S-transferase family protein [Alphaproteobacteria bacterium]
MAQISNGAPLIVYGTDCSYYTGKLEAILRAKGISYRLEPFDEANMRRAAQITGVSQIPQVECPDGSWLVDTTLILEHLEATQPEPALSPSTASAKFISKLLEDFADEWLWRPAMHYRWSYPENARLMSAWLAEHIHRRVPTFMKRRFWYTRQLGTFVVGDGVTDQTRAAVESAYLDTLAALETIFKTRPYIMGERPVEADFGFFASLFRHFACDPAPGRIMRARAPAVHEWVARMWNADPQRIASAPLPLAIPNHLAPLLLLVSRDYLPYLDANAKAFANSDPRVQYAAAGVQFDEPTKPYRVWCRDRLVDAFAKLDPAERAAVERAIGREAAGRLANRSPRAADDILRALPIAPATSAAPRKPVDSWWRR